jgi:hypothetical protein
MGYVHPFSGKRQSIRDTYSSWHKHCHLRIYAVPSAARLTPRANGPEKRFARFARTDTPSRNRKNQQLHGFGLNEEETRGLEGR